MKLYGKRMMAIAMALTMVLSLCSLNIFAVSDYALPDIEHVIEYTGNPYYDDVDLEKLIEDAINEYWDENNITVERVNIETSNANLYYGEVDNDYYYTIDVNLDNLNDTDWDTYGEVEEAWIYFEAMDDYGDWYDGRIDIIITDDYGFDLEYDLSGETELYLGEYLIDDLDNLMTETLDYVEFDLDRYNDCGELYYIWDYYDDEDWELFDDTERYYYNPDYSDEYDVEDIYFEPDGTEGEFIIYYTAYGRNVEEIEGTITIYCSEGLLLEVDIDSTEYYTFDSEDFQDAVDNWDNDYSLIYIDNIKLSDSEDGVLYYDYDESSRRNDAISATEEYYVEDKTDLMDYISFVPDEDFSGTATVHFDAYVKKTTGRGDDTLHGVLKINVDKAADITIEADPEEEVEIDYELFQDYLDEDLNSNRYDVAYVTITNAPRSKDAGYLVTDDTELTSRSAKTFYMNPSRNQYDLEDLYYQAGEKKGTYSATFTVYYYARSSSTTATASTEGTIDFVIGSGTGTGSISNPASITTTTPLKASQVMNFAYELAAVKNLGGNDNEYIEFTSLPINGKLYYNFGTADQQDVTVGKYYYLTSEYGQLQLSKVTYVPSYSSSKVMKYDTIFVQGYNAKDKAIKGSINIAIQYASYSAQFTDVKDSTYADSVDYLYNQKITTGMTATTFGLTDKVTRGQFVTFLYRAAGSPVVTGVTNKFTDVKVADYYYNAVLWAVKNGITSGMTDTTFEPNMNVTHEQLLTFLYRYDVVYLGHSSALGSSSSVYDYNSVESWAQIPVKWAVGKNVISYGNLLPKDAGTRATVALWLHRMLTL